MTHIYAPLVACITKQNSKIVNSFIFLFQIAFTIQFEEAAAHVAVNGNNIISQSKT